MYTAIKFIIKTIGKMFTKQNNVFVTSLFLILRLKMHALADTQDRFQGAKGIAEETYEAFLKMFGICSSLNVPGQQFKSDNLKGFINFPSRTTVGSAPKVTSHRKFFANLVSTRQFREMLDNDVDEIRMDLIKKMKYCDNVIMSQNIINDFYDREVDQTKI